MTDPRDVHRTTPLVYTRNATTWDAHRPRTLTEAPWLARLTAGLGPGDPVLDVGCGAGEPIAAWLVGRGFAVTGLDIAPSMVALCVERFPAHRWRVADMRGDLPEGPYAAIIAWDSFFHLAPSEQRETLPRLAASLRSGGRLVATVGPRAGEVLGSVAGESVYHSSLDPSEYERLLVDAGMSAVELALEDAASGRTVLFAER